MGEFGKISDLRVPREHKKRLSSLAASTKFLPLSKLKVVSLHLDYVCLRNFIPQRPAINPTTNTAIPTAIPPAMQATMSLSPPTAIAVLIQSS